MRASSDSDPKSINYHLKQDCFVLPQLSSITSRLFCLIIAIHSSDSSHLLGLLSVSLLPCYPYMFVLLPYACKVGSLFRARRPPIPLDLILPYRFHILPTIDYCNHVSWSSLFLCLPSTSHSVDQQPYLNFHSAIACPSSSGCLTEFCFDIILGFIHPNVLKLIQTRYPSKAVMYTICQASASSSHPKKPTSHLSRIAKFRDTPLPSLSPAIYILLKVRSTNWLLPEQPFIHVAIYTVCLISLHILP